jgi:hypothetical protein
MVITYFARFTKQAATISMKNISLIVAVMATLYFLLERNSVYKHYSQEVHERKKEGMRREKREGISEKKMR